MGTSCARSSPRCRCTGSCAVASRKHARGSTAPSGSIPTKDDLRRRLLSGLATIASLQGDHVVAVEAADEAADLATELGGATGTVDRLREQALAALLRDDFAAAEPLYEELLDISIEIGNGVRTSASRLNLATIANHTARHERAEELLRENLAFVRARGQSRCEATTLAMMAETSIRRDRPGEAAGPARTAAMRSSQIADDPLPIYSLELVAAAAAEQGDAELAAMLLGGTEAARSRAELTPDEDETFVRQWAEDTAGSGDVVREGRRHMGRGAGAKPRIDGGGGGRGLAGHDPPCADHDA